MKPNAARAASDRRAGFRAGLLAWGLLALAALAAPARAGDRALIDFIGFSADARYFAFEEFGIQDGSGFAYSSVYILDLKSDSWVLGSPIAVQADSETESLARIRAKAMAQAAGFIDDFGLDGPVEIAALIGDGVPEADGKHLRFGLPGYGPGVVSGDYRLALRTFEADTTKACADMFGSPSRGYELTVFQGEAGRLVHRDTSLPRSRGCPLDYRLYGVVMPFDNATLSHAVAILSIYRGGFEGPDRRFLAVPLGL